MEIDIARDRVTVDRARTTSHFDTCPPRWVAVDREIFKNETWTRNAGVIFDSALQSGRLTAIQLVVLYFDNTANSVYRTDITLGRASAARARRRIALDFLCRDVQLFFFVLKIMLYHI